MQSRMLALLALVLMMLHQTTSADVSLTSQTVVGNILHENLAAYAIALMMLIVACMIWLNQKISYLIRQ